MSKISCNVIQDIMPLYVDEIVSEDTKKLVEEHLKEDVYKRQASQQFAMIPMNLMKNRMADYIVTGQWAKKAADEAEKYGTVNRIASSADKTFSYIPDCSDRCV